MIIYASRTGNVEYITTKLLGIKCVNVDDVLRVDTNFILITYTDGLGQVPKIVEMFMKKNYQYCKGVIASGNTNFGINNFCGSADKLSQQYNIPVIRKIELRGYQQDYNYIIQQYNKLREEW